MAVAMSEGNPGAIVALGAVVSSDPIRGVLALCHMDDMNIAGSTIHVAFKDLCGGDPAKLIEAVSKREQWLVDALNSSPRVEQRVRAFS